MTTQFPTSLPEFQKLFPNDSSCEEYLEKLRWPSGFVCPSCGHREAPLRFPTRATVVLRCRACKKNASLTAGTVMHMSKMPATTWFWAAYLVSTQTPGISAVQFQRQLEIKRYETAFTMLHKLREGMVRPERDPIGSIYQVEIDECYVGGATRGEGEGIHDKTCVIGAVEVRRREGPTTSKSHDKRKLYAGRLRLAVVEDRSAASLIPFVVANVAKGAKVKTDAWDAYNDLCEKHGYSHESIAMRGSSAMADKHLPMIHRVFSNLKTWLDGTHHGRVELHHLQAYLNEFVFRFNRRFYPMNSFNSVLGIGVHVLPPTYEQLYSGEWEHPT